MGKHSIRTLSLALLAVVAVFSLSPREARAADDGIVAIAFTAEGYRGLAWKIDREGRYDLRNGFDLPNDSICSVMVRPGYKVTLFEDGKFDGEELELAADAPALPLAWRRQASSLVVEAYPDYADEWLEAAEDVDDYVESQTTDFDGDDIREVTERYRDTIAPLLEASKNDWYGDTTDDERITVAGELLEFFDAVGFDVSEWTPNSFAQQMNNLYDWRGEFSVLETACIVLGVDR